MITIEVNRIKMNTIIKHLVDHNYCPFDCHCSNLDCSTCIQDWLIKEDPIEKDPLDWNNYPNMYWRAWDADGSLYYFSKKPSTQGQKRIWRFSHPMKSDETYWLAIKGNTEKPEWKESLDERPKVSCVKSYHDLLIWLAENNWSLCSDGGFRKTEVPTKFTFKMFQFCGKECDQGYYWLADWLEEKYI